jgi:hypothetical protein
MGVTIARWCIAVAAVCTAIAALALPFPDPRPQQWVSGAPAPLASEVANLVRASGNAYAAVRRYRSEQALDRWREASRLDDTTLIRIDATVPAAAREAVRTVASEQWASFAQHASGAHAEIFVYVDSSSIARADVAKASRRPLEPRRFLDVSFALPDAVDGARCVAIVRLRGTSKAHLDALRNESLVDVCGFFAAFGMPGAAIRAWLGAEHYRFARRSDWTVARAPAIDASSLYALGERGGGCLTGRLGACDSALGLEKAALVLPRIASDRMPAVLEAARPGQVPSGLARPTLGDAEGELLADMVRDIGPERFRRFWRSDAPPDAAFVAATGEPLAIWTRRWLDRVYGPAPQPPAPHLRDVVWLALAMGLAALIAARPRQAVLAERLRPFGV